MRFQNSACFWGKWTATSDGILPGLATAGSPQQSYTGQLFDAATGLLYYDARWFDPFTKQFLSEDPLSFTAGDKNLKRSVRNFKQLLDAPRPTTTQRPARAIGD